MSRYLDYQDAYPKAMFRGVHLDVEPHQDPDFSDNREDALLDYSAFVIRACADYGGLDFDIPFWFDSAVYETVISSASRVFVMSYRDTAEAMRDAAAEELAYAKSLDKPVFLCAEIHSDEGDRVSYGEEGKSYMYGELNKLKAFTEYGKLGLAIHHIETWKALKD
jgi:hypothetical protein